MSWWFRLLIPFSLSLPPQIQGHGFLCDAGERTAHAHPRQHQQTGFSQVGSRPGVPNESTGAVLSVLLSCMRRLSTSRVWAVSDGQ